MPERAPPTSLQPISPAQWTPVHARHLLWRAGFGGTPRQVAYLAGLTPERAVGALLDFDKITGSEPVKPDDFDDSIMSPPSEEERQRIQRARRAQDEDALARIRLRRQDREQTDRKQIREMQRWWLRRMIESPRPLEEKLTLLWHGHFATSYRTIENSYHMFLQNQLFRKHAAGNFGELLFAIIRDPAMLAYLDNNDSRKERPNENFARELMELFSLGEGRYAERDIKEGARALTGYSFENNAFIFRKDWHDEGTKNILGRAGPLDGDGFARAILEKRECAEFIAIKLYRFFVAELPMPGADEHRAALAVIRQLAGALLGNKYEIRPTLRKLFLSEHFYDPANMLARIKSPAELVVGLVRSCGTPVRDLGVLLDAMDLMGQNPLFPPSVKGWDGGRSWINTSTLFVRANIANFLLTGRTPEGLDPLASSELFDPLPLLIDASENEAGAERDIERLAAYLVRFALGQDIEAEKLAVITEYMHQRGGNSPECIAKTLALIAAMPEYQLC